MDETTIKIKDEWVYFYRAVDKSGDTIDFILSEYRDKEAATLSSNKPSILTDFLTKLSWMNYANYTDLENINMLLILEYVDYTGRIVELY